MRLLSWLSFVGVVSLDSCFVDLRLTLSQHLHVCFAARYLDDNEVTQLAVDTFQGLTRLTDL
jgi:hypothetical protein